MLLEEPLPPASYSTIVYTVPEGLSFNAQPGNLELFESQQLRGEFAHTHLGPGLNIVFNNVGGDCNHLIRPFADFDTRQGHAHPRCRYEPSEEELDKYKASPIDLAIVIPYGDNMTSVPRDKGELKTWEEHSAYAWRAYAERHKYKFYVGPVHGGDPGCFHELEPPAPKRAVAWVKVCVALQLVRKHKYLLVVDADTVVLKPGLPMEPLFEKAGLLEDSSGKVMALASEWGSCGQTGLRKPISGAANTGVLLLKNTAAKLLRTWFYNPDHEGDSRLYSKSMRSWAYDQLGFDAVAAKKYQANITVWPSGCPINGPWGDFISHLVGGSFNHSFWNPKIKNNLLISATRCTAGLLEHTGGSPYRRCSLCDVLPQGHAGFDISCAPGRPK